MKCKFRFAEILWILFSVLDHCYNGVYRHFKNDEEPSHQQGEKNVKTPYAEKLKWSACPKRDEQSVCSAKRKNFVINHCEATLGKNFQDDQRIPVSYLKEFQENCLSLQAVTEVDQAGRPICRVERCPHDGSFSNMLPKLVRAKRFEYVNTGDQRCFNSFKIHFEELESVRSPVAEWSDTTVFNLLHYFRNRTIHRSLISVRKGGGWFNPETPEWVSYQNILWVLVPEIALLRDENNTQSLPLYEHPLHLVLTKMFKFVESQRRKLLTVYS